MKILDFKRKKQQQDKICMLTCYDYPSAVLISESKIDCVLVGDSVAMTVHGHPNTLQATLDMMVLHTSAVARGLSQQFIIADLPFLEHRISRAHTMTSARQLMQAGAHSIKIEGGDIDTCNTIEYLVQSGVPVMGHIGLTPQSIHQLGGHRVQGKTTSAQEQLIQQALQLEASGVFALVIECVPNELAKRLTQTLSIPTIGIGAGSHTDGQVLVWHDLLGLTPQFKPRFVKQFSDAKTIVIEAINAYAHEVKTLSFPALEHSYSI